MHINVGACCNHYNIRHPIYPWHPDFNVILKASPKPGIQNEIAFGGCNFVLKQRSKLRQLVDEIKDDISSYIPLTY